MVRRLARLPQGPGAAILAALLFGCTEPGAGRSPRLSRLEPATAPSGRATPVVIYGERFEVAARVSFIDRDQSSVDVRFSGYIGPLALNQVVRQSNEVLTAVIPAGLPVGWHALSVTDPWGQTDVLPDAFEVTTGVVLPGAITGFRAIAGDGRVELSWVFPVAEEIASCDVVRTTGRLPGDHRDGTLRGSFPTPVPGSPGALVDARVANGTLYGYAGYCRDAAGVWDDRTQISNSAFAAPSAALRPEIVMATAERPVASGATWDLGVVLLGASAPASETFFITNVGTGSLQLTGTPHVTVTPGGTVARFAAVDATVSPLLPGEQTAFSITATPLAVGTDLATVSVANDDADESPFTLRVAVRVAPWWNAAWGHRRLLRFDNRDQTETDLVDFPVLVQLDDSRIDYALTAAGGADLRFIDAATDAELAHEIEAWDVNGESFAWVKVPFIPRGSRTAAIWVYYGNDAAPSSARPAEVWSAGFAGVFHLGTDLSDSTVFANHGTNGGSTAGAGRIAGGRWLDYLDNDRIVIDDNGFSFGAAPRSLCAWARTPTVATTVKHWFISYGAFANNGGFFIGRTRDELWCGGVGNDIIADDIFRLDTWQYHCCTFDGTMARIYSNGVLVQGPENKSAWSVAPGAALLGDHINSGESWDGGLDEARISSVARSRDWIAAEYRTMTDTFIDWGPAESRP